MADMPLGRLREGVFANNRFASNPVLNQPFLLVQDGRSRVLVSGQTPPGPDLLAS